MTLEQYIKKLQHLLDSYGDMECYYAVDDEGNSYQHLDHACVVGYVPSLDRTIDYVTYADYEEEGVDENWFQICVIN